MKAVGSCCNQSPPTWQSLGFSDRGSPSSRERVNTSGTQWFSPPSSPANPTERIFLEERQAVHTPKVSRAQGHAAGRAGLLLPGSSPDAARLTGLQGVCLCLHV